MSWLVCDSKHLDSIKNLLEAKDKSADEDCSLCITVTPNMKLFIFEARRRPWAFHRDEERKRLSVGRDVFFCMLEEHVMASEIAFWQDGVEMWRVEHNLEKGVYHLDDRGNPPPSFERIKRARFEEQEKAGGEDCGVDYVISIPMDLAGEFTGYAEEPTGTYLEWSCPKPPKPVGILGRLFGRQK